ncbi:MAG: polyphenol oxidase family protein [Acidobacteria bacterium]|jgi:hypothetical protein|nr:polyphenol oxidase family protein [Acidobacteriota bacterium]
MARPALPPVRDLDPAGLRVLAPERWCDRAAGVRVCFSGAEGSGELPATIEAVEPAGTGVSWLRQVHGRTVVAIQTERGECGEGDALVSSAQDLALAVVTADCVPVLIGGDGWIAAVHAGWRGVVAGVVAAALARLPGSPAARTAWIGPAIGPCCYEVGEEVAAALAVATSAAVIRRVAGAVRPHADLGRAVAHQLAAGGVGEIRRLGLCTRCGGAGLHSYRRDGRRAGRNVSWIVRD